MNLGSKIKDEGLCGCVFESIKTGVPAIPSNEIFEVAKVSIEVAQLLREQA